jgi:hypothetical protein
MEVSGRFHAAVALLPGRDPRKPLKSLEVLEKRKTLVPTRNRTAITL